MRRLVAFVSLIAALLPATVARAALRPLHVGPASGPAGLAQVLDDRGRVVLLRGVNVNGLEDFRRADLRPPYPIDPAAYADGACPVDDPTVHGVALCASDLPQMRAMGYDVIRLALSWSELEPQPGQISAQYLDRIAQVVGWARQAGIYVLLDMHQDGWSKYVSAPASCPPPFAPTSGDDGAPAWATAPVSPSCAPDGTSELSPAVAESFQRFYADLPAPDGVGLQEHYAAAVAVLARRFAGDTTVAGYELLNEPHPGLLPAPGAMDAAELFPFYAKVVAAMQAAVPGFRQLVFVEPDAMRNITDQGPVLAPWSAYSSYPNVVFAPHVYTGVFTADEEVTGQRFFPSDGGYRSAIRDAQTLGLPLWVGEFGCDPADDQTILRGHYVQQDADALGGALWVWREHGTWGVYPTPRGDVPRPSRLALSSRAYPMATNGTIRSLAYDPDTHAFSLRATAAGPGGAPTRIFLPAAATGATSATAATLRVVQRDDGTRLLLVRPRGGDYSVAVAPS